MDGKKRTVMVLVAAMAVMVGLVAASVPLYSLFCKVTGYAGTPRIAGNGAAAHVHPSKRTIVVRFDGAVMRDMPWRFGPAQNSMTVHLGETTLAYFTATNQSDQPVTGTATFNVTPLKAARFVNKIQCFCFTEQRLAPGQTVQMPVSFFIEPAIATDPQTDEVGTITLSYTFFKARDSRPATAETPGNASPETSQRKKG